MPPPATPSPFRLSRHHPPTRRSSGPRFAKSPRFLLSQSAPRKGRDDFEIVDDDFPPSTASVTHTPARAVHAIPQPRRQRDVIEDSDDDEWLGNADTRDSRVHGLVDDSIDSSPPCDSRTPGALDADFDATFATRKDGSKRQRLSIGVTPHLDQDLQHDDPQRRHLSSPEPQCPTFDALQNPVPRALQHSVARNVSGKTTPGMSAGLRIPSLGTPESTQTPFRGRPRFVLSTQQPTSSQSAIQVVSLLMTQPASTQERRKLAFVLPRSPSPNAATEDIPTPFSPSSRTLHRRGKNRAGVAGYVPGGMAADVRSWILDMGSTREQVAIKQDQGDETAAKDPTDLSQYLVAAYVVHVRPAVLSSSGSFSFVRARKPTRGDDGENDTLNIVLMGPPRSKALLNGPHTGFVHEGDLLGIHRGLAWHVSLDECWTLSAPGGLQAEMPPIDKFAGREKWLVAMEWDLIKSATQPGYT